MAILHALLDTDKEVALTIITDSQISIDNINTLLARGNPSHKLVCNYAVFRTICDIIKTRAPGSVTRVKVKAHEIDGEGEEAAATTEQLMNKGADVWAKKATEPGEGPILLKYPFHNLERAVLKDAGVMCEGKVYGTMMWKLDKWAFEQDLLRSGSCRYDVVGQEGVWHAASAITPKDIRRQEGRAVHVFQSGGRCLPTTKAINNLNQHLPHATCTRGTGVPLGALMWGMSSIRTVYVHISRRAEGKLCRTCMMV